MTGDELRAARRTLGELWGLGRPLRRTELGRLLGLRGALASVTTCRDGSGTARPVPSASRWS